jgi:lysozyme
MTEAIASPLRARLVAAAAAGALATAGVFIAWYEGTGPTEAIDGVTWFSAYRDVGGVWTVCHGLTGAVAHEGARYTESQCAAMETERRARDREALRRLLPGFDEWPIWRQTALFSFLWNVGEGNLAASTLRRKFAAGDVQGGCDELVKWSKARTGPGGALQTVRGLLTRREAEASLCVEGL